MVLAKAQTQAKISGDRVQSSGYLQERLRLAGTMKESFEVLENILYCGLGDDLHGTYICLKKKISSLYMKKQSTTFTLLYVIS